MRIDTGRLSFTPPDAAGSVFHPLFQQQLNYEVRQVPDDPYEQVKATIKLMCRYAVEDSVSPEIQREAHALVEEVGTDKRALTCAVWRLVRRKIQFLKDEVTSEPIGKALAGGRFGGQGIVEVLVRPRDMANMGAGKRLGDCDDYSSYVVSLLTALWIPSAFVTIAGDESAPWVFTHVYVAAYPDGVRVPVDASHGPECGWGYEVMKPKAKRQEWPVEEPEKNCGAGVGGMILLAVGMGGLYWVAENWEKVKRLIGW